MFSWKALKHVIHRGQGSDTYPVGIRSFTAQFPASNQGVEETGNPSNLPNHIIDDHFFKN